MQLTEGMICTAKCAIWDSQGFASMFNGESVCLSACASKKMTKSP